MKRGEQRGERLMLALFAIAVIGWLMTHGLAVRASLHVLHALYPYFALMAILSGTIWTRQRFQRLCEQEQQAAEALRDINRAPSMFTPDETQSGLASAQQARAQFEKWMIPALAPLLAILLGYWGYRLLHVDWFSMAVGEERAFTMAATWGIAFILFLFGRYTIGLSRHADYQLLRGPGHITLLTSLALTLVGAALLITELAGIPAELWIRRTLAIYLLCLAIELLINTIVYLYVPKKKDRPVTTYESRLTSLLTDPRSWSMGLAQSLDYQFGFGVSETGFYRFLRRALAPLVIVQVLLLYGFSMIVVLGPDEEAILERFGDPYLSDGEPRLLTSGIHFKRPWPFDTVRRHSARRIRTLHIGFEKDPSAEPPPLMVWTQPHYLSEEPFIVASRDLMQQPQTDDEDLAVPVNMITVNLHIEYRVTNLYQYVYTHLDANEALRLTTRRALTRELASRDLLDLLGEDRQAAGQALHQRVQTDADNMGLGLELLFVGLHGAHPPIPVASAFESVIGSLEERETSILEARAFRNRTIPLAAAEADELRAEAEADRVRRSAIAQAEANVFATQLQLFQSLDRIYTQRLYFDALSRALMPITKHIVATHPDLEVILMDLHPQGPLSRPSLLDMEDRFL